MGTSTENAFLNPFDWSHPVESVFVYILYANGTCWRLSAGISPILWTIPARLDEVSVDKSRIRIRWAYLRAVYEPRENPIGIVNVNIKSRHR